MRRHDVGMAFEQIAYPARRALLVKTGVARRDIGFGGRELARPLLVLGGFEPDRVVRQDDRHHPRENRAVDEEVDHAAYFFSADLASDLACAGAVSAAASLPRSTGCTSAPGFTCCRPSTISLSPALTPSVTSH